MQTLNGTCSSSSITKLISSSLYDIFFLSSSEVLRVIFVTIIWEFHLPFSYRLISTQCGVEKSTIFSLTQHRRHFQTNLISCQSFFWIAFSTIIIIPHQNIFSVVVNSRIAIVSLSLIPETPKSSSRLHIIHHDIFPHVSRANIVAWNCLTT